MKNSQKGFIVPLVVVIAVLVIGGAYVYIKNRQVSQTSIEENTQSTLSTTTVTTNIPTQIDETADWKTYKNERYGFEIKYPFYWDQVQNKKPDSILELEEVLKASMLPQNWGGPTPWVSYSFKIVLKENNTRTFDDVWDEIKKESLVEEMGVPVGLEKIPGMNGLEYMVTGGDSLLSVANILHNGLLLEIYLSKMAGPSIKNIRQDEYFDRIISSLRFIK